MPGAGRALRGDRRRPDDALTRTAPSPAVFERIAAAVATHPNEPAVRESLRERRRLPLRRVIELQQWGEDNSAAAPSPARRSRCRWAAAGLPAVAAILLVAFTAVALRGLGMHMPQVVTQPSCAVSGDPVVLDAVDDANGDGRQDHELHRRIADLCARRADVALRHGACNSRSFGERRALSRRHLDAEWTRDAGSLARRAER